MLGLVGCGPTCDREALPAANLASMPFAASEVLSGVAAAPSAALALPAIIVVAAALPVIACRARALSTRSC